MPTVGPIGFDKAEADNSSQKMFTTADTMGKSQKKFEKFNDTANQTLTNFG